MDLARIVSDLKQERDRLSQAIAALESIGSKKAITGSSSVTGKRKRRNRMTPEGRKRLSDMMTKRWAERRRKLNRKAASRAA